MPFPIEMMAVVAGTLVSKYCHLPEVYNIRTVGHIPTGWVDAFVTKSLENIIKKLKNKMKNDEKDLSQTFVWRSFYDRWFKARLIIRQTAKARVTHFAVVADRRPRQHLHNDGIVHDHSIDGLNFCPETQLRNRLEPGIVCYGKFF